MNDSNKIQQFNQMLRNIKQRLSDLTEDFNNMEKYFILNFKSAQSISFDNKPSSLEKISEEPKYLRKESSFNNKEVIIISENKGKISEGNIITNLNDISDIVSRSNIGLNTSIDLKKEINTMNNFQEKRFDYKNFKETRINNQSNLRFELKENSSKPKNVKNWIKRTKVEENKNKDLKNLTENTYNVHQGNPNSNKEFIYNLEEKPFISEEINQENRNIDNLFKKYKLDSEKKENKRTDHFMIEDPVKNIVESDTNEILSLESCFSSKKKNLLMFDEKKAKNISSNTELLAKKQSKNYILDDKTNRMTNNDKPVPQENYQLEFKTFESDNNYDEFYGMKKFEEKGNNRNVCKKCKKQFKNPDNKRICYECEMEKQIENNKNFTNKPLHNITSTPEVY